MAIATGSTRRLLASPNYKWWAFATIGIGTFVSVGDQTGVNLALPRIADHFDATIPAVQWVTLGYVLTTGSLLLPMGKLSDMIGRKRVYVAGFAIFTLAAVLTGLSPSLITLVLFKLLQGVGAAMVQANGMAIVTSTFPGSERGKAIGLFMTVVGLGAISGPVVGGGVVGLLGWRYIFFLGAPFGIASIIAAMLVLDNRDEPRRGNAGQRSAFDWPGAVLSAATLTVFLLMMTNARRLGWSSPLVAAGFVGAAVLLVAFALRELRAPEPMLAMELFRRRLFSLGSTASFISFLSGASVYFLMPFYLQGVLGHSPAQTGLLMAATALAFAITGPVAGRFSDRFGWRRFSVFGLLMTATALIILSRLTEDFPTVLVVTALALHGVGMGTFQPPNASAVLSTVERSRYGIATAFLNMIRNAANLAGVGMATAMVTAVMASSGYEPSLEAVSSSGAGEGVAAAFSEGLRTAYTVMAGLIVVALVATLWKTEK